MEIVRSKSEKCGIQRNCLALLIGASAGNQFPGAKQDVMNISTILARSNSWKIKKLVEGDKSIPFGQPTKSIVLAELKKIRVTAKPHDFILFFYSGPSFINSKGKTVLYLPRENGAEAENASLSGKEIAESLAANLPGNAEILIVLDCSAAANIFRLSQAQSVKKIGLCRITRDYYLAGKAPDDQFFHCQIKPRTVRSFRERPNIQRKNSEVHLPRNVRVLESSSSDSHSYEFVDGNLGSYGIFSAAFASAIQQQNATSHWDYKNLLTQIYRCCEKLEHLERIRFNVALSEPSRKSPTLKVFGAEGIRVSEFTTGYRVIIDGGISSDLAKARPDSIEDSFDSCEWQSALLPCPDDAAVVGVALHSAEGNRIGGVGLPMDEKEQLAEKTPWLLLDEEGHPSGVLWLRIL